MEIYNKFIIARFLCAELCKWTPTFRENEQVWYEGPEGESAAISDFKRICLNRINRLTRDAKEHFVVAFPEWIQEVEEKISRETRKWREEPQPDASMDDITEIFVSINKILAEIAKGCRFN